MRNDGIVSVSVCDSRKSVSYKNVDIRWSEFVKKLGSTVYTKETMDEYINMPKGIQDEIKDVGGFVGGSLKDGKRRKGNVVSRSVLTLDADYAYDGMEGIVELLYGFACCVYSTHKHSSESPRLRFVIPLSRNVSGDEYEAVARKIANDMGMDYFDDSTYEPERMMYFPSTSSDGEFVFRVCEGDWLYVDEVLSRYSNWSDVSSWPVSRRCSDRFLRLGDKQENPRDKDGIIGAFCRTYDVHDAIDKFLSDVYVRCEGSDRYTYVKGSSSGGAVIYGDGDFVYSHHSTDPCYGRLCNAFDLVRIHKFCNGSNIEDEKSFNDMLEFCSKDKDVVIELGRQKVRMAQNEFAIEDNAEVGLVVDKVDEISLDLSSDNDCISEGYDDSWLEQLEVDKKGNYKCSIKNLVAILENDSMLKNHIKFDEFCNTIVKTDGLPWSKSDGNRNESSSIKFEKFGYMVWDDYDDALLRCYLEKVYGIYAPVETDDAVSSVAKKNSFNPIRNYLKDLEWDGIRRVDSIFIDYLGSSDNRYTRAVTRKIMAAAVARVYEPGIKFDYMPVLVGPQGVGKSHILSLLGGCWYSDSFNTVLGKEAYEQLQGSWIIEMAELSAIRKVEAEAVKHFISKRDDVYRAAYGRRVVKHPRQCVFFGTTNESEFLKDKTGNRRYWPIVVSKEKIRKDLWKDLSKEEIDQIWAEATVIYRNGELLMMEKELSEEVLQRQEEHMEDNIKEGMILEYLEKLLPIEWAQMDLGARRRYLNGGDFSDIEGSEKRERVCAMEIWCELFGGDPKFMNPSQSRELNDILRRIEGWQVYPNGSGKLRFSVYGTQRAFVRK